MSRPPRITAIALDDEAHALETLAWELAGHCPGVELQGRYTKPAAAREHVLAHRPDLLLLDVDLHGSTGFEFLEGLGEAFAGAVIFTTAHEQYALRAFEVSAVDYLLKPVDGGKLAAAVARVAEARARESDHARVEQLARLLALQAQARTKVPLPVSEGIRFIEARAITHLAADGNYTHIHLADGTDLLVSKTMRVVQQLIGDDESFRRIHKSYVVNRRYVRRYSRAEGGYVELDSGRRLSVGRSYRGALG